MSVIGIVPARGGSKGIPRKNVIPLGGKPLMAWVLEEAKRATELDIVVVSTEDAEIAAVARDFGVRVIDRPPEFATDTIAIDPSLRHAVRTLEAEGMKVDMVVWLQANVPTTKAHVVDKAVRMLREEGGDSVQTVVPYRVPPQWSWVLDESNRLRPFDGCYQYTIRRQEAVRAYHLDGAVNAFWRDVLMNSEGQTGQAYFGKDRRALVVDPRQSIEVDEPLDLEFVRFLAETGRL